MKQHLAKSLLMAGAMIASYPLLAQQTLPAQPVQPAQRGQPMQSAAPSPIGVQQGVPQGVQPGMQPGVPAAAPDTYAQGSGQSVQYGVPPTAGAPMATNATPMAPAVSPAMDPSAAANSTLPPDALGSRLGQRSSFLDGA